MTCRRGVFISIALTAGLGAAVALARPGIVKTIDGQTYTGDVEQDPADPNVIVVKVRGIPMRLEKARVASTEYTEAFEKEFADQMAKLAPNDIAGRLALAREALDREQYTLAREAAEAARTIDPNSADAVAMLETIRSQMRLDQSRQTTQPGTTPPPPRDTGQPGATSGPGATTEPAGAQKVLKPVDINAIRQAELRPQDGNVRIRFDRDVSRRYQQFANILPRDWNALTDADKAQRILTDGTPEMKRDVLILNDPPVMLMYRNNVQRWVLQNCATSGCHGGPNAAKFALVVPGDSDAAAYTNFYLLQRYRRQLKQAGDNLFGRGELRMVDRQTPAQSLLLQYALPGSIAEHDHPDVQNYKLSLKNVTDPRYRVVHDWIASLRPVDQNYGVVLDAQDREALATTQPATTQAATAPGADGALPKPRLATRPTPPRPPGAVRPVAPPAGAPQPQRTGTPPQPPR